MPYTVTAYNVMIGSPSDVQERECVETILAKWNRKHGEEKKIVFLPIKWEDDSYPDAAGQTPQKVLNQQICERSDMLIAIFWTKLGSPTDEYESGTIEEINVHINAGKQVFLYFCEKALPYDIDKEQYEKLRKYRTELEKAQKIFYATYKSEQELEDKMLAHLDNMVFHKGLGHAEVVREKIGEPCLGIAFDDQSKIHVVYETPMLMRNKELYSDNQWAKQLEVHGGFCTNLEQEKDDLLRALHSDIPEYLVPYLDQCDMEEFNRKYTSEEEIERYINSWRMYLMADNATECRLKIENAGPGIADNILVEIDSPQDHLLIVDQETYNKIHTFQCGINPIKRAREKYAEKHNAAVAAIRNAGRTVAKVNGVYSKKMADYRYKLDAIANFQSGYYLSYRKGTLKAHCKKLLYEHSMEFSESVYMIPVSPGEGYVQVTFSCDQYSMCKNGIIQYEVTCLS